MPVTINGDGSITGLSVGGLGNGGVVDADSLASNAVTNAKIAANAVTSTKIADLFSSGSITIGGVRIQTGTITTDSSTSTASDSYGISVRKYRSKDVTGLTGFASAPKVWASLASDYHDAQICTIHAITTSQFTVVYACSRDGGIQSKPLNWLAIGEAS